MIRSCVGCAPKQYSEATRAVWNVVRRCSRRDRTHRSVPGGAQPWCEPPATAADRGNDRTTNRRDDDHWLSILCQTGCLTWSPTMSKVLHDSLTQTARKTVNYPVGVLGVCKPRKVFEGLPICFLCVSGCLFVCLHVDFCVWIKLTQGTP